MKKPKLPVDAWSDDELKEMDEIIARYIGEPKKSIWQRIKDFFDWLQRSRE